MMRDFMPVNRDPLFFSFMNPARDPPVRPSINNIKFAALLRLLRFSLFVVRNEILF